MIEKILAYQNVEKELVEIKQQLTNNEDRKRATNAQNYIKKSEEINNGFEQKSGELIQLFTALREQYKDLADELKEITSGKETVDSSDSAMYYENSAIELVDKIAVLEQKITAIQSEMTQTFKDIENAKERLSLARKQFKENGAKYNEVLSAVKPKMETIQKELAKIAKDIEPAIMEKYKAKRNDNIFPVFYKSNGKNCGHCLVEFPLLQQNELAEKNMLECEHCHVINYKE